VFHAGEICSECGFVLGQSELKEVLACCRRVVALLRSSDCGCAAQDVTFVKDRGEAKRAGQTVHGERCAVTRVLA
jgi:hypothetical protein